MRKILVVFLPITILVLGIFYAKDFLVQKYFSPTTSQIPTGFVAQTTSEPVATKTAVVTSTSKKDIEIVSENLNIPWEIAFLPTGEMLVTERPGNLLKIGVDKKTIKIEGVAHIGEGGLLGLAIDPKFNQNKYIYLYSTTKEGQEVTNRVEKYKLDGDTLTERKVILSGIKGSSNHDGGRIKFGLDNYLYVTTGDAENSASAQDKSSLNGKILRVDTDGNKAPDNPFGNAVYSYGHRNPQGLAWDEKGNLWSTEHGPSGTQTGNDEVNLIIKGENYGWPEIKGLETRSGMKTPIRESGKSDTWAPGGVVYYMASLFFGGLRGEALYQGKINGNTIDLIAHFKNQYGRIRTVALGPDGYFYLLTSNTDGRGTPKTGDDKIIKVNPELFVK